LHREFVSAASTSSLPYRERPNTVVYAGSISDIRGLWEMAQALELLPAELDCQLRLVGSFRHGNLARELSQRGVDPRLELVPFQPYPGVIRELLSAKIGVVLLHPLPNHADVIRSNKLFEYMAAGIPVIASDLPQWREIVGRLDCGLVVDPFDPVAVAGAIEYLLTHPAEAEAMGQRGRDAVRSELNWDADGARLLALYRTLIDDRAPASARASSPAARPSRRRRFRGARSALARRRSPAPTPARPAPSVDGAADSRSGRSVPMQPPRAKV
jgi:glycosyltransferase involved in cell wall biosynthesis